MVVAVIFVINMLKGALPHFQTVEIPAGYKRYNQAEMMAGLINVAACISNMLTGMLYGFTADHFGWSKTIRFALRGINNK